METITPRETSGTTTRVTLAYLRRHHGPDGVRRLLELAGERRSVEELEDERTWSTYEQKIALFEAAEQVTGDEWVARRIGESLLEAQIAPGLRLLIGALGSPQKVLRSCAKANAKFSTTSTMEALEAVAGRAVVAYRLDDGYVPSLHDCRYTQGVLTQATVLFGLPPAGIAHHECQVAGADACRYELTWPRWRTAFGWLRRRTRVRPEGAGVAALREQMLDLQATVADLVSVEDLDEVLRRIADRASAAVRGQSYLLAVRLGEDPVPRVHSDGLDPDEALERGRALFAGRGVTGDDGDQLVAEVASTRQRYGWLAAYLPGGTGFLPDEQAQLEAYAALAAAALDAATALAEARRRRAVAEALLTLGHELAHQDDAVAVAERVVEAAPVVVGSARSMVLLWDEVRQRLSAVAAHGYGPHHDDALRFTIPLGATPVLERMLREPRPRLFAPDDEDPFVRQAVAAFAASVVAGAPIVSHGRFTGLVLAGWPEGHRPAEEEQRLLRSLSSLADQAGVAMANVILLEAARHQARHDPLTGLPNRVLLHERIEQALADGRRSGRRTAVCFLDLDRFKDVNDALGHAAGDQLLVEVARRLRACVRETDALARISGDEFVVLLRGVDDPRGAERVAAEVVQALSRPYRLGDETARVGASVGVALGPDDGTTPDDLLRAADAAMYEAKQERGTYRRAGEQDQIPVW